MKQTIVTPIIKKTSLDWKELKNYRPVSNISFIGKVIEHAAISQFKEHMEKNDLNEVSQSAYKNKHSTETALLKVKDNIHTYIHTYIKYLIRHSQKAQGAYRCG